MTATRSHIAQASPTSWVMKISGGPARASTPSAGGSPGRAPRRRGRHRLVADQALGPSTSAAAITTRWRWPPDSSCGYRSQKRAAGRNPAFSSAAAAIAVRSSPRLPMPWICSGSWTSAPTVIRGLRDWYGSWNTIWIRRRSLRRPVERIGAPSNCTSPPVGGSNPSSTRPSVDLPQPDSPTIPSTSPRLQVRSTPSSAGRRGRVPRIGKCTSSSRISNSGACVAVTTLTAPSRRPGREQAAHGRCSPSGRSPGSTWHRSAPGGSAARSGIRPARRPGRAARRGSPAPARAARRGRERAQQPLRVRMLRVAYSCSTGPDSAIWPPYMIATRSHVSASTDRSWVIRIIDRPRSRRSSSSSSRICACIITSSAVVGSSPMISSGLQASARAIITRWRMPPENSCGYCRPGSG